MSAFIILLLIVTSPVLFPNHQYRDIPTNDKPSIRHDAAIARFNAEFVLATAETDNCHSGQLDLIKLIESSSAGDNTLFEKGQASLSKVCHHSFARMQRFGRLYKMDYEWMTARETAKFNDLCSKQKEILGSILRIVQLLQLAQH